MNEEFIKELISKGETSSTQFKLNISNELSIAQEMVAFANAKGGTQSHNSQTRKEMMVDAGSHFGWYYEIIEPKIENTEGQITIETINIQCFI
jgi:hypothetical protein